jgi:hypothetical protein
MGSKYRDIFEHNGKHQQFSLTTLHMWVIRRRDPFYIASSSTVSLSVVIWWSRVGTGYGSDHVYYSNPDPEGYLDLDYYRVIQKLGGCSALLRSLRQHLKMLLPKGSQGHHTRHADSSPPGGKSVNHISSSYAGLFNGTAPHIAWTSTDSEGRNITRIEGSL